MVAALNLAQEGAIGSYLNPVLDPGYAPGGSQRGALEVIPEPATVGLLLIGGVAALCRRRHRT